MKQIFIIFKKDLIETLRDRRTLVVMIVIPLLLFPLLFSIIGKITKSSTEKEIARLLRVGIVGEGDHFGLETYLMGAGIFPSTVADTAALREAIRADSLDLGLALEPDFADRVNHRATAVISTFGAMSDEIAQKRLSFVLQVFDSTLVNRRLDSLGLSNSAIHPTRHVSYNTELTKETIGKMVGGFLPYIFIIFCYMGSMFPAIDLFTGEKERGSIETLLSSPVERWKILVGKMMVIVLAGISTALLSLTGMFFGIQMMADIPQELIDVALGILTPSFMIALLAMLLPMVIFFAGFMIPATVYAKSFKEASSILQPLNFTVIIPAVIGTLPGMELNLWTAMVPVLNVVLSTKELIAGTMDWGLFVIVIASLLLLATGTVALSFKRFGNEKNVLRN